MTDILGPEGIDLGSVQGYGTGANRQTAASTVLPGNPGEDPTKHGAAAAAVLAQVATDLSDAKTTADEAEAAARDARAAAAEEAGSIVGSNTSPYAKDKAYSGYADN